GRFTDVAGVEGPHGDTAVSTNGLLHDDVLALLAGAGRPAEPVDVPGPGAGRSGGDPGAGPALPAGDDPVTPCAARGGPRHGGRCPPPARHGGGCTVPRPTGSPTWSGRSRSGCSPWSRAPGPSTRWTTSRPTWSAGGTAPTSCGPR